MPINDTKARMRARQQVAFAITIMEFIYKGYTMDQLPNSLNELTNIYYNNEHLMDKHDQTDKISIINRLWIRQNVHYYSIPIAQ